MLIPRCAHPIFIRGLHPFRSILDRPISLPPFLVAVVLRVVCSVDPSPDGLFLIVSWLEAPYSFQVPCGRFPKRVQLWDAKDGSLIRVSPTSVGSFVSGRVGVGQRERLASSTRHVVAAAVRCPE